MARGSIFIRVKILCEESGGNRGGTSNGTMAVRLATEELAEHFLKIVNRLEMRHVQCEAFEQLAWDEMRTERPWPRVIWRLIISR